MIRECPYCGASVRSLGRRQDLTHNDHHNGLYQCGGCDRELVSG
jgi:DNA-directed RNA polymerase subunit RPC12/RpoP